MQVHVNRLSPHGKQEQQDAGSQSPPLPSILELGQNTHQ
jgi:hypothetical protein